MEAALALPQLLEKLASRAPLTGIDVIGLRLLLDRADAGSDASLAEQLLADDPAAVAAEQRQHHTLLLGLLNDVLRDLQKHGPRVGRGYTRQVRAWDHRRLPGYAGIRDRVAEFHARPEEFKQLFGLLPAEFDHVFAGAQAELDKLPRHKHTLRNRLAMALRRCRKGKHITMTELATWFGVGSTIASEDVHAVMDVLFEDQTLKDEVRWPSVDEIDQMVQQMADWAPNLAGVWCAADVKKRLAHIRGRTFNFQLHKVDYDGNKGHGRHIFIVVCVTNCRIVYLDSNFGARHEAYAYREYDISRELNQRYWRTTRLPINRLRGRPTEIDVHQNGVTDSAYDIEVCNAHGAPHFVCPDHSNEVMEVLNENLEQARCGVEVQIGRVGNQWPIASDDAGPWSFVGNGGKAGEGSELGMARSVRYFIVCARLTALTQRMRDTYPRKPEEFLRGKLTEEERLITLRRITEGKRRRRATGV